MDYFLIRNSGFTSAQKQAIKAYLEFYFQSEPVDYLRSSSWRVKSQQGTLMDRMVGWLGPSGLQIPLLALAILKATCRVSVRCRKKG